MDKYNRRDFLKAGSLLTGGLLFGDSLFGNAFNATEPFLGAIKIVSFGVVPNGWAKCDGQFLPINQNQALFSLLGTTYGGDTRLNIFALPDFRGRVPIHFGNGHTQGESGGSAAHTISIPQLPSHVHSFSKKDAPEMSMNVSDQLGTTDAPGNHFGINPEYPDRFHNQYDDQTINTKYASLSSNTGGSQAHENRMPFLTLNFIIALQGIYPSQT